MTLTYEWACYAWILPAPVATDCAEHGTTNAEAERHTRLTGHPTTYGTPRGVAWARRAS